jgi:type II secretory pathway predicted ATPase ExeA
MYEEYWGLKEKPFENTPDPRFIYYSPKHKEALARMHYAVRERKGAALFTGEYGSGKTLLSRVLWGELQQENRYQSALILDPRLSALQFIREIIHQLSGNEPPRSKIELFHALHELLYANYRVGKITVIVIDEAQAIKNKDIFEELRLLLNFQLESAFLLTIVLLGQPELKATIVSLPQLSQRIAVRYHLEALDETETREYVQHRLKVAGVERPLFDDEACREIYFCSKGLPRGINNLCDLALLVGYGNSLNTIDKKIIRELSEDLEVLDFESQNLNKEQSV